ncbi:UNVERIFIED_CONTAM: hypothetical protein GTU68_065353 [Idotea baltica]|nr:hypothetical protein [Idotea baltica]
MPIMIICTYARTKQVNTKSCGITNKAIALG